MKIFKIVLVNISILIILGIITEFLICLHVFNTSKIALNKTSLSYTFKPIYVHRLHFNDYFIGRDDIMYGRAPDGVEYTTTPIILFGCSFAHGQYLDKNKTLSALLSQSLKRPVYNRAIPGQGFQEMYYQSSQNDFYKVVKNADTALYVIINDQYRRMYVDYFDMKMNFPLLGYNIKHKKLLLKDYNNPIKNFFRSLYTTRLLQAKRIDSYINTYGNAGKITDEALLYFLETRKELEKHYKHKIKFGIIFYEPDMYDYKLGDKLQKNGFLVLKISKITKENLTSTKYLQPSNGHPTEQAWKLLLPDILSAFFSDNSTEMNNSTGK